MANRKVSRVRATEKPVTIIVHGSEGGEHVSKVYELATRRHLATARGSAKYAREVSALFAKTYDQAKRTAGGAS